MACRFKKCSLRIRFYSDAAPAVELTIEMAKLHSKPYPFHQGASWHTWLLFLILAYSVAGRTRPNFVIILTDDQDLHMGSMEYMPNVQKYIRNHGAVYRNHYCSTSMCCPARATLWTGKLAHNTNLTDVIPPYGEVSVFARVS